MTDKEKLEQISLSLEKFQRTGDVEHLEDIERMAQEQANANIKAIDAETGEIKNRQGKMVYGVFVKDSDLEEVQ